MTTHIRIISCNVTWKQLYLGFFPPLECKYTSMVLLRQLVSKYLDHMGSFVPSANTKSKLNKANKVAKMLVVQMGCPGGVSANLAARALNAFGVRIHPNCPLPFLYMCTCIDLPLHAEQNLILSF